MQRLNRNGIHFNTIQASNMTSFSGAVTKKKPLRQTQVSMELHRLLSNMDNNSVETTVMSVGIWGYAFTGN